MEPEVLLLDEPTSALDPVATELIEELMGEMRTRVTIVIVTHNMEHAARVSDQCAFLLMAGTNAANSSNPAQPTSYSTIRRTLARWTT